MSQDVGPAFRAALDDVVRLAGQAGHTLRPWAAMARPPIATVVPPVYYHDAECTGCGRLVYVAAWHGHPVRVHGLESDSSGLAYVADWPVGRCVHSYCGDRVPAELRDTACACRFGAVNARCPNRCHCHDVPRAAVRASLARLRS